jgi:hypothetical protein
MPERHGIRHSLPRVYALLITALAILSATATTTLAAPIATTAIHKKKPHTKPSSPVTKAQVQQWIASYLVAHPPAAGATGKEGPAGKDGQAGVEGKAGTNGKDGKDALSLLSEAEQNTLKSVLPYMKLVAKGVDGKPTIEFSGVNVQVVNGEGSTETTNGEGNVVIGYDTTPGTQTGSGNLVLGEEQSFTSYGGLVAGFGNTIGAPYASVTGGHYNIASDSWSSVMGGCDNLAGAGSVPTGPCSNQAEAILGGASNHATGVQSTITAGQSNSASGPISTVSGGLGNASDGLEDSITGGYSNTASENESSITGGGENTTTGDVSTVTGGYYNTATADEAVVVGGCSNVAGAGNVTVSPKCTEFGGSFMSILGGIGNKDTTVGSTIAGGETNTVTGGQAAAIAGGHNESLTTGTGFLTKVGKETTTP